jgi:uncharacterized membrane protein
MNIIANIFSFNGFLGLVGIIGGFYTIKESFYINHHILFLGYFERKFGPGQGTTAYKFIGLAILIFSTFVFIGTINLFEQNVPSSSSSPTQKPQTVSPFQSLPKNTPGPNIAQ